MITPDDSAEESTESKHESTELCAPEAAFAVGNTPPEVGDDLEFTAKGKVTKIENGKVYFSITSANDEPVTIDESAEETGEDEAKDDGLMKMAQKADEASV